MNFPRQTTNVPERLVPKRKSTHRRGTARSRKREALSEDLLRLAGDDLAARRSFRTIFFVPAAVFICIATIIIAAIVDTSSTAISGSARKPRPAAAKRRFARGSGAQSQSKKGGGGRRARCIPKMIVGTERPRRIRGW